MVWTYPESDLDIPGNLLASVGGLWSSFYTGSDLIQSILAARAELDKQTYQDMQELFASLSRLKVPVFHVDRWYQITLLESQLNANAVPLYNGAYAYTATGEISYGQSLPGSFYSWTAPAGLVNAKVILNRITTASVTWTYGTDFFLNNGNIAFVQNPFDTPFILPTEIFSGNQIVDRQVNLWLYSGEFDQATIYRQYGYVLASQLPSSEAYKSLINAIFDGIVGGTTETCINQAIAAICDVPLALGTETVEQIATDASRLWIITDQHAYGFSLNANPLVQVGAVVQAGDSLADPLLFYEFNSGQVPNADQVSALAISKGFLKNGYFGDLTFLNQSLPTTVTTGVDGLTVITFPISGAPGDITQFWEQVHARGVAAGQTLAQAVDTRTIKVGEPRARNLPTMINPLGFLLQNLFRYNLCLCVIQPTSFGPSALGLNNISLLRKMIPPGTALIILVQLKITPETINMDLPTAPGMPTYSETVTSYLGLSVAESIDPLVLIGESVRVRTLQGRCE